jgi:hypothetical protein
LSRTTADCHGHLLGGEQSAGNHIRQIDTQLSVVGLNLSTYKAVDTEPRSAILVRYQHAEQHQSTTSEKEEKMRTYITSKSLKRAAGTLVLTVSVVSAVFGLTGCGSHGGDKGNPVPGGMAPSTIVGSSSAQFEVGNTVE